MIAPRAQAHTPLQRLDTVLAALERDPDAPIAPVSCADIARRARVPVGLVEAIERRALDRFARAWVEQLATETITDRGLCRDLTCTD
jgi:hypothetical protein